MEIKEKVLKEMLQTDRECRGIKGSFWNWEHHVDGSNLPHPFTSFKELRNWFEHHNTQAINIVNEAIDLTLAEVGKVIDECDRIQDKLGNAVVDKGILKQKLGIK